MNQKILIGIDGGGTHSTAVAALPDGRVLAVAEGGGLNFHNDGVEAVRLRLEALVRELCARTGASPESVCAGLAALDAPADPQTLALFHSDLLPPGSLDLQSDAYIALLGFTRGAPGMIVICGTGSMLLLLDSRGIQHVSGGWGYLLGDAGSGYTLSRDALMAVAAASDGLGSVPALTARALRYFGADTPRGLIDQVYAPGFGPNRFAGFGRCVLEEADRGDPAAQSILRNNMSRLASQARELLLAHPDTPRRVGLYGGIFTHSEGARGAFTASLQAGLPDADVGLPELLPELGAVLHLLRRRNSLADETVARLRSTWQAAVSRTQGDGSLC